MAGISDQEKAKIASNFIAHAPPGEFNEVFNDIRVLVDNDELLRTEVAGAFAQHNKDQFIPCKVEGSQHQTLITEWGDLGGGRFLDPRSKTSFRYDHLRKEGSDVRPHTMDAASEPWRAALERDFQSYVADHYKHGASAVYGRSEDDGSVTLVCCTESHQFNPKNFWNGRLRAQWSVTFPPGGASTAELRGVLKVQVHYYEDGNVQLVSSKELKETIGCSNEQQLAKEFVKIVSKIEDTYQQALSENYQTMSDTTFKALRRQLPITKSKIDWQNIMSYRIGAELKNLPS